jgi:hypothetical protein
MFSIKKTQSANKIGTKKNNMKAKATLYSLSNHFFSKKKPNVAKN